MKQQIPPLHSVEKHFQEESVELQIPPLRCAPVGMTKGRIALPFRLDAADDEQQIPPLRSGRDDKGEGSASIQIGCCG
jgi:hypothetical protein